MPITTISIKGDDEFLRYLGNIPEKLFRATKIAFTETALRSLLKISTRIQNGSPMYRRTGNLSRSMRYSVTGNDLNTINASVFSASSSSGKAVSYAAIHETGGTIRAKNAYSRVPGGPYLNIPTSLNKTASGVQRLSAREVFANGGKVIKSKSGNYLVFGKTGAGFAPMFVLKKSVTIPPRLEMRETVTGEVKTLITTLSDLLNRELSSG